MDPDVLEDVVEVSLPLVHVVPDPDHGGLVDLLLRPHVQHVRGDDVSKLGPGDLEELLILDHLLEVIPGVLGRDPLEPSAGVSLGEGPDAQAVAWIKLPLEKLATKLLNIVTII